MLFLNSKFLRNIPWLARKSEKQTGSSTSLAAGSLWLDTIAMFSNCSSNHGFDDVWNRFYANRMIHVQAWEKHPKKSRFGDREKLCGEVAYQTTKFAGRTYVDFKSVVKLLFKLKIFLNSALVLVKFELSVLNLRMCVTWAFQITQTCPAKLCEKSIKSVQNRGDVTAFDELITESSAKDCRTKP